jgi:hypothetical protein
MDDRHRNAAAFIDAFLVTQRAFILIASCGA